MDISAFLDSWVFSYVVLPALIFLARICDVTIGTVRLMMLSRGNKIIPPILGFFEVLVWILAVSQIFQNLRNVYCYVAFAGGFAMGNYVGMLIEEKLAVGTVVLRYITKKDPGELMKALRETGFGFTNIDAHGSEGNVQIIFMIVNRKDINSLVTLIKKFDQRAFYTIENVHMVREGIFPERVRGRLAS